MNKKTKLALSIKKQFGCSASVADEWADDVLKSEHQPNGRIQPFQEFAESTAGEIGDDLGEQVKARAKAKAGIKTFNALMNNDPVKMKIQYQGGIRS